MDFAFLERIALRETGRRPASERCRVRHQLLIYPAHLCYRQPVLNAEGEDSRGKCFLEYGSISPRPPIGIPDHFRFIVRLLTILPLSGKADMYVFSHRHDWIYALITFVAARLLSIPFCLHDYQFRSNRRQNLWRIMHRLSTRLDLGDMSGYLDSGSEAIGVSYRSELIDQSHYRSQVKSKAVPRVIVYGDFESRRIHLLSSRAFELVKQKYPRTEFILISLTAIEDSYIHEGFRDESFHTAVSNSEDDLYTLFADADIVMLLSPGGLNRSFLVRAEAAGYPVIVNDLDYSETGHKTIPVVRDSYSGLADAVIRLVDDDAYYRSFAALR